MLNAITVEYTAKATLLTVTSRQPVITSSLAASEFCVTRTHLLAINGPAATRKFKNRFADVTTDNVIRHHFLRRSRRMPTRSLFTRIFSQGSCA